MAMILYNFAVRCYQVIIWLLAPFNPKAKLMISGREQWLLRLSQDFSETNQSVAWFHCASLGEFEQGRPIIERYQRQYPDHKILLTFFSPSGYEVRKNYPLAHAVHYLPWDTRTNMQEFYHLVKPVAVFIIKYEYWYHLINQGNRLGVPVVVCSAIFRENQVFFKWYGGFFRKILMKLNHLFVQDQSSSELLKSIGITQVSVCGDTRVDRVVSISKQVISNQKLEQFANSDDLFIVGSSWPQDLDVLADLINQNHQLKFVIAPHEVSESQLAELENTINRPLARYTNYQSDLPAEVLIIDTIGILSHLYKYGKYAYIGGAFGKGLHNTLEAATFGLPLFFGNRNYQKFAEARALVAAGGAFAIGNTSELQHAFNRLETSTESWDQAHQACLTYIQENTGATEKIIHHMKNQLIK